MNSSHTSPKKNSSSPPTEKFRTLDLGKGCVYDRKTKDIDTKPKHRYEIYVYKNWILIKRAGNINGLNLWIDRDNYTFKETCESLNSPDEIPSTKHFAYAIIGVLKIVESKYLVIVLQENFISNVVLPGGHSLNVYMIASALCLPISPGDVISSQQHPESTPNALKKSIGTATNWFSQHFKLGLDKEPSGPEAIENDIRRQISLVERLLENGFYYSIEEDLGVKFQDFYTKKAKKNNFKECKEVPSQPKEDPFDFILNSQENQVESMEIPPDNIKLDDETSEDTNEEESIKKKCNCSWSNSENITFRWNHNMGIGFPCCWLTCLIQGYFTCQVIKTPQGKITLILIARRSIHRPGTRISCRGIDDSGHVANFVESELAVILPNGNLTSLIMCRGSVPVFWEQTSVVSSPSITHCLEMIKRPFLAHFKDLAKNYGDILCINLLNDKWEQCLTNSYTDALKAINNQNVYITAYPGSENHESANLEVNNLGIVNFYAVHCCEEHSITALEDVKFLKTYPFAGKLSERAISLINYNFASNFNLFSSALELVEYISNNLTRFMCSHKQLVVSKDGEILTKQKGCIRVNCLDCLDRTNVFQWCYGWIWFLRILESIDILDYIQSDLTVGSDFTDFSIVNSLPEIYKFSWSSHGDAISLFYSGTVSTYSSYILQGSSNLSLAINYARTYLDRIRSHMLEDQQRSEAMDIILSKNRFDIPAIDLTNPPVLNESTNLKIWCGTWNIAGMRVQECENLNDWLDLNAYDCDIYAFYIQEVVELTTFKVLTNWSFSAREQMIEEWFGSILNQLNSSYLKIRSVSLLGLCLFIFAKSSLVDCIADVEATTIKTGLSGNYGNKGAVAVRMKFNTQELTFLNVHLPPGKINVNDRIEHMEFIVNNVFHNNKLLDDDLVFLGGDFNFRLHIPHDEILKSLSQLDIETLLEYDEFITHKKNDVYPFKLMNEHELHFHPSYKFKKNSPFYDLRRSPAWCDRIFFLGRLKEHITPLLYKRHEKYCFSDHKPVSAVFQVA